MDVQHRNIQGQTPRARVGALIHDYFGYVQRETRRQDDKRVRAYVALRLSSCVKDLLRFRATEAGRLNGPAEAFDLSLRRLRNSIDAVTDVPTGYSSFFDAHHLRNGDTMRLVAADLDLIERAERLVAFVERLTRLRAEDASFFEGCTTLCSRVTE